jgi:NAD dependent epimerase/dehydratase family enzyme
VLSRGRDCAPAHFPHRVGAIETLNPLDAQDTSNVIVNLAGQSLRAKRWNENVKRDMIARPTRTPKFAAAGWSVRCH